MLIFSGTEHTWAEVITNQRTVADMFDMKDILFAWKCLGQTVGGGRTVFKFGGGKHGTLYLRLLLCPLILFHFSCILGDPRCDSLQSSARQALLLPTPTLTIFFPQAYFHLLLLPRSRLTAASTCASSIPSSICLTSFKPPSPECHTMGLCCCSCSTLLIHYH